MTAVATPKGYTRHPNGGGLVADTANVAPGAYVRSWFPEAVAS